MWNSGSPVVYIGSNTVASTVSALGGTSPRGFQLPTTPFQVRTFATSTGAVIYGATSGTSATYATNVQYVISSSA